MALCRVTGTLYVPSGEPAASYVLYLTRLNKSVIADYNGSVVPDVVRVPVGRDGSVDFDILTGTYYGIARPCGSSDGFSFNFAVPNAPSVSFSMCIDALPPDPPQPAWLQLVEDAVAASEAALELAEEAETSAAAALTTAQGAETSANAASSAAATADGKAVAAMTAAGVADGKAVAAMTAAVVADGKAVSAQRAAGVTPFDFGAVGDGVADDTAALQATFDWAKRLETDLSIPTSRHIRSGQGTKIDLCGRMYGVSSALYLEGSVSLSGGSLTAIAPFPTGGAANSFVLNIGKGRPNVDISVDGGLNPDNTRNANCVRIDGPRQADIRVYAIHFPEYGIRVVDSQECRYRLDAKEWLWEEAGRTNTALRTAKGISVETADNTFIDPQASTCHIPLYVTGSLNQFIGGHTYNGGTTDGTDDHLNIVLQSVGPFTAENNLFTGHYSDNGMIRMVDAFKNSFTGMLHQKNIDGRQTARFEVVTSAPDTDLRGLVVIGNRINGSAPEVLRKTTTGAGSFRARLRYVWAGNINSTGGIIDGSIFGALREEGGAGQLGAVAVSAKGAIDAISPTGVHAYHIGTNDAGEFSLAPSNNNRGNFAFNDSLNFRPTPSGGRWYVGPSVNGRFVATKDDLGAGQIVSGIGSSPEYKGQLAAAGKNVYIAVSPTRWKLLAQDDFYQSYAAMFVPDKTHGYIRISSMTGDMTILPPVEAPKAGDTLVLSMQVGAGDPKVLTWATAYRGGPAVSGVTGTRAALTFVHDGDSYIISGSPVWA